MNTENKQFNLDDWIKATPEQFNLVKEYYEQVMPILMQLEKKCEELKIPFVFRANIAQTGIGNTAGSLRLMGTPERATPDIMAMFLMDQFNAEYINKLIHFISACQDKYGKEDEGGILVP